jgi:Tol biopolymer transport system component
MAQSPTPVDLTLRSITQVSRLNDVEISPDGQTIAFVSNHSGAGKIWIVPVSGGEPKILLPSSTGETSPQWSPDGKRIAFLSGRAGQQEIWVVGAKGGEPKQLTSDGSAKHGLRWSPDGTQIAYISNLAKTQDIYIVNAVTGGPAKQLTQKTNEWQRILRRRSLDDRRGWQPPTKDHD